MKTISEKLVSVKQIRFIGLLYLLVIILAGFSQGYVRGSIFVPGDSAETASRILENHALFRLGIVTDLLAFMIDAIISVLLYQLFKPMSKNLAMVMSSLRLLAHPAIASMNLINHYLAYKVLHANVIMSTFNPEQLESLSTLFLDAHSYGYMIAGAFFGIHCLLLGILIYKSDIFPNIFGGFMIGAAAGYLIETFGNFSLPGYEESTALIVGVSAALGEVSLTLYMIIKGTHNSYKLKLKNTKS